MKGKIIKSLFVLVAMILSLSVVGCGGTLPPENNDDYTFPIILSEDGEKKNVILFIGDGMGPKHEGLGEVYQDAKLRMQEFPYVVTVDTSPYNRSEITDSAAAGTAMATGKLTLDSVVGMDHEYNELETIMDIALSKGKRTGIISTESLVGATPSAFYGHAEARGNYNKIVSTGVQSGINFLAGYPFDTNYDTYVSQFEGAGYTVKTDLNKDGWQDDDKVLFQLLIKAEQSKDNRYVMFEEVVENALDYLSQDPDGFVLMAEGAHIDKQSHANQLEPMLKELLAFDLGIETALKWASKRNDTVIIVTADHETGGLNYNRTINKDNMFDMGSNDGFNYFPKYYTWTSSSHTSSVVNCHINGLKINFSQFAEFKSNTKIKNTDIFKIIEGVIS